MAIARGFMETLPFWEMVPSEGLLTGSSIFDGANNKLPGQVFVKPGEIYAFYLPLAEQTGTLDLSGATGALTMQWFNPHTGEAMSVSPLTWSHATFVIATMEYLIKLQKVRGLRIQTDVGMEAGLA